MPNAVFVLGPGHSFCSLLSTMLGRHPGLAALPELNLNIEDAIGPWLRHTAGPLRPYREGLLRALARHRSGRQTAEAVAEAEAWLSAQGGMTTAALFAEIAGALAPRAVVSPCTLSLSTDAYLARLAVMAPGARFIHLCRHPFSAGQAILECESYRATLMTGFGEGYDRSTDPPVLDPQFHWGTWHDRIGRYLETLPPARWRRVQCEALLTDPQAVLEGLLGWLELPADAAALDAMLHPEEGAFARPGPPNAPGGAEPGFLAQPRPPAEIVQSAPLSGPLPWRGDGQGLDPDVVHLAGLLGYAGGPPETAPSFAAGDRAAVLERIVPDGEGFPMPHANMMDDSTASLPPLRALDDVRYLPEPAGGGINFGAYSGENIVINIFENAEDPALVARDPDTGETLWQSGPDMLPPEPRQRLRWTSGLLLARLELAGGAERRHIYAFNSMEALCLDQAGRVVWRRPLRAVVGAGSDFPGTPRCIRITADQALLFVTSRGFIAKLDPLTGATLDVRELLGRAAVGGRLAEGRFSTRQSIALSGDFAYVEGMFAPDGRMAQRGHLPTCLLRLQVSGTADGRIAPLAAEAADGTARDRLQVGVHGDGMQGGSPCALRREDGAVVVITNGYQIGPGGDAGFGLAAVIDEGGALRPLWDWPIEAQGDPKITAAPAVDPVTGTYVATTAEAMIVIRDAATREGRIRPDMLIPTRELLTGPIREKCREAGFSSALALSRSPGERNFVCYVAMSVATTFDANNYSFLTAAEFDFAGGLTVRPLWSAPMKLTPGGDPAPGSRSFAQPALFRYGPEGGRKTGISMGTMRDGVAFFR